MGYLVNVFVIQENIMVWALRRLSYALDTAGQDPSECAVDEESKGVGLVKRPNVTITGERGLRE